MPRTATRPLCLVRPVYPCVLLPEGQPGMLEIPGARDTPRYLIVCLGDCPEAGWRLFNLASGQVYEVCLYGDWPPCTCADATYRGRICKHNRAVAALHAEGAF